LRTGGSVEVAHRVFIERLKTNGRVVDARSKALERVSALNRVAVA
jgi:hypothetical protein